MRKVVGIAMLLWYLPVSAQQFIIEKGKDTLFIGEKDTLVSLPFKLEETTIGVNPKLNIKIHSGTAKQGKDFVLRDAYNATTNEVNITNVENKAGSFQMYVTGNPKEYKWINVQTIIIDNGVSHLGITKLIIAPSSKKKEEKPKEAPKDSLAFVTYRDINLSVYSDKDKEVKLPRKRNADKDSKVDKLINIFDTKITQLKPNQYRIQVTSTENEVYYAILEITNEYQFREEDRLYLNGDRTDMFLHAAQIFRLEVIKAGDVTKSLPSSGALIKFKL